MGKQDITQVIIEVAPPVLDLLTNLLKWILIVPSAEQDGKDLEAPLTQEKSFQQLADDCNSKVIGHFFSQFGYIYNGSVSNPPQNTGTKIGSNKDFYSVQANDLGAIGPAISAALAGSAPTWCEPDMVNDLGAKLLVLARGNKTDAWLTSNFTLTYTNKNDDGKTYQCDTAWLYCVTPAEDPRDPGNNVNTLFLYSLGVCYHADPWFTRLEIPGTKAVVRILYAVSTTVIATAIASYIFANKNRPAKINVVLTQNKAECTIVINPQEPPPIDDDTGAPVIPYSWATDALRSAGITQSTVTFGTATADEIQEFEYLQLWGAGDFSDSE